MTCKTLTANIVTPVRLEYNICMPGVQFDLEWPIGEVGIADITDILLVDITGTRLTEPAP